MQITCTFCDDHFGSESHPGIFLTNNWAEKHAKKLNELLNRDDIEINVFIVKNDPGNCYKYDDEFDDDINTIMNYIENIAELGISEDEWRDPDEDEIECVSICPLKFKIKNSDCPFSHFVEFSLSDFEKWCPELYSKMSGMSTNSPPHK